MTNKTRKSINQNSLTQRSVTMGETQLADLADTPQAPFRESARINSTERNSSRCNPSRSNPGNAALVNSGFRDSAYDRAAEASTDFQADVYSPLSDVAQALTLSQFPAGSRLSVVTTEERDDRNDESSLLEALGIVHGSVIEICSQGQPCLVKVGKTRIGLPRRLAMTLRGLPIIAD